MKKWIVMGVGILCMCMLQACTTTIEPKEERVIEPLPVNPAQAAAFLAQNKTEPWVQLIAQNEGVEPLEINSARVERSESGLSTVWLRLGSLESAVLNSNSHQVIAQTLIQMQVRCLDNHYRYLSFYALDKNQNVIDAKETPQAQFLPFGSGAAAAGMYRIACEANPGASL